MKAIVCEKYGPPAVLQIREVAKPTPKDSEVLVKAYATCVNYNNLAHISGQPLAARAFFGLSKPNQPTPGNDIAGLVEAVGRSVTQFRPGDAVFGYCTGAFAEYVCTAEKSLALKPLNATFDEAATLPEATLVALNGLRDVGKIQPGQHVLVYGASGGIGTFAVQLAKTFGAEVTGVCSTRNLDLVRSIGADHVIDYTCQDFTNNGHRYDLILATAGYRSLFDYKRALNPEGKYVVTGGAMSQIFEGMLLGPVFSLTSKQKMSNSSSIGKESQAELLLVKGLVEAGKVKPVIDRRYPLDQAAKALEYYAQGHACGKVVITITTDE